MVKEQYVMIEKDEPEFPVRDLVQSKDGNVVFSVFGPNYFSSNVEEMNKTYSHPKTGERITFREPTIAESIDLASYDFEGFAKPKIFDSRWLQAGRHVRTQEGVYTNTHETDEKALTKLLNGAEKVNGIYLINDKIAFIPYDSFEQGDLEVEEFAEQGLARGLEHTSEKKAEKLARMGSKKNYSNGIWVGGWDSVDEPVQRISELGSIDGGSRLDVDGNVWSVNWGGGGGYAFGVLGKKE